MFILNAIIENVFILIQMIRNGKHPLFLTKHLISYMAKVFENIAIVSRFCQKYFQKKQNMNYFLSLYHILLNVNEIIRKNTHQLNH